VTNDAHDVCEACSHCVRLLYAECNDYITKRLPCEECMVCNLADMLKNACTHVKNACTHAPQPSVAFAALLAEIRCALAGVPPQPSVAFAALLAEIRCALAGVR